MDKAELAKTIEDRLQRTREKLMMLAEVIENSIPLSEEAQFGLGGLLGNLSDEVENIKESSEELNFMMGKSAEVKTT